MQFQLTTIHVNDLEESLNFYQDVLNLAEVKRLNPRPGVEISFLQDEGGTIELISRGRSRSR
ncbi:VOC family protein [Halanaerobacter jeridensis]|uniref:Catechol 2,3-dioxygenase-like lactoylglutathione lyase family enzyme n=1 Tax=Halanaerobacter jeridensis TaxID=706427 RepID=A0A939BS61_9FIRM|nr:VOC family protein [Halanaerobacter jeridensis]MBM7556791.1 catechol 2,3-dioxygenase-like lactoylglutathione lyase family enzyme [Halanaerobacter jeridensis]